MAEIYIISSGFDDFVSEDYPNPTPYYIANVKIEERKCEDVGYTEFLLNTSCYHYWNQQAKVSHKFKVLIDGTEVGESAAIEYEAWRAGIYSDGYGTAVNSAVIKVPALGGRHRLAFVSSSSKQSYEFDVDLHPLLEVTIGIPDKVHGFGLNIGATNFEAAKTMVESGYAYGSSEYSWSAEVDAGYELKPPSGSGVLTEALMIAPVVSPMATADVYANGAWGKHLIYIYSGGAWGLYQAEIYSGGAWSKYF